MKIIFTLTFLLIITISSAVNLDISGNSILIFGNFDTLDLSEKNSENSTFTHLQINDCVTSGKVSEPELPIYTRLINLPNQGNYVAQIVYEGDGEYLKNIKDIVVDADSRIIYILDEIKVFSSVYTWSLITSSYKAWFRNLY